MKMKTHKGAAKRFKVTGSGKVKRNLRRNTTVGTNGEAKVLKRLILA